MSTSYQFSQEHNFQSILWAAIGAVSTFVRRAIVLCTALYACLPAFMAGCAIVARALGLVAVCVAGVVAVAMIPPVFWLCLVGIAVGAYVTFPRSAKPAVCPYCGSKHISGGRGSWDCDDCGRGGSY